MSNAATRQASKQVYQPDNFETGRIFEEYVINLFNANSFHLMKWHKSEKFSTGVFLLDHSNPDLEMVFVRAKKYRFAVECKYRKEFREGKITWAENLDQIARYQTYQNRNRIPVFVVIGIGGEASNPEKLFVTPLNNICQHPVVFESDLIPYKRNTTHRFFYNTVQLRLF